MTLGEEWKRKLGVKGLNKEERRILERAAKLERIAAELPGKVQKAISRGETSVEVYGWVTQADVFNGDVDEFFNHHRDYPLEMNHVSGIALAVVKWCNENGLDVFIESQDIPMNENEHNLVARPMRVQSE